MLTKAEANALESVDRTGNLDNVSDAMFRRIRRYLSRGWDRWRLNVDGLSVLGEYTKKTTMTKALQEIASELRVGDVQVLNRLSETQSTYISGRDYDFACDLVRQGLAFLDRGLHGWSGYFLRTPRGSRVLKMQSAKR